MALSDRYQLVTLPGGEVSIRSLEHGEVMHVGSGPRSEALALHIRPQKLAERAAETNAAGEPLVLWDVGLGAAANAVAALETLRDEARGAAVELHSFEVETALLAFALQHVGALGYLTGWGVALDGLLREERAQPLPGVTWRLHRGDFRETLHAAAPPHVIFHDPYSPAKNPGMWSEELFRAMRQRVGERACRLTSYTRSTAVRTGLVLAGWQVGIGVATGAKEETTLAATRADLLERPLGKEWLERVRRSSASAPLRDGVYRPMPISAPDWERLVAAWPLS